MDMPADKTSTPLKKVLFEYPLNTTSVPMMWNAIATAPGLAAWFADNVDQKDKTFVFSWGKHECREAEMINCRQNTYVRFRWKDGNPVSYFELRLAHNDLTGSYLLEVTDFAEPGEEEDVRSLWDSSIDSLHRCGL